jgi:hypothetical protein
MWVSAVHFASLRDVQLHVEMVSWRQSASHEKVVDGYQEHLLTWSRNTSSKASPFTSPSGGILITSVPIHPAATSGSSSGPDPATGDLEPVTKTIKP